MTPLDRLLADPTLTVAEKIEDARWRMQATPEQRQRADELTTLWYREKDAAEAFARMMAVLIDRRCV